MFRGTFAGPHGEPRLSVTVIISRLGISRSVAFLVDTGADFTVLSPKTAIDIGINYNQLSKPKPVFGIAGEQGCHREKAMIVVAGPDSHTVEHPICIGILVPPDEPDPDRHRRPLPSLLGRDVLNHFRMVYDPMTGTLCFRPNNLDWD